ncbi:hypothetical protein T439DRAFT_290484, partial [Meredithblackwellia eburnea MCA 4105]
EKPWYAVYPTPKSTPIQTSAEEVHELVKAHLASTDGDASLKNHPEFLIVDVRRTDFDVAFIPTAINLPAHSLYPTLPSLLPLLTTYKRVIFHCQSSSGRGPRSAGWYQDLLDEKGITGEISRAEVLTGGIKGWVKKYGEDGDGLTVRLGDGGDKGASFFCAVLFVRDEVGWRADEW